MEKKFYVYKHVKLDSNETFYVGKGIRDRAFSKFHRNKYWKNIVNKHGYKIVIIKNNLYEKEALLLEHKLICLYKRYNRAEANLNLDYGLGGRLGRTDEDYKLTGLKISKSIGDSRKGILNKNYGNKYSLESCEKISKALKGKRKGIKQSEDHINNRIKNLFKKVINLETGEIYTIQEVSKLINKSRSHTTSILNGRVTNNTNFRYYE